MATRSLDRLFVAVLLVLLLGLSAAPAFSDPGTVYKWTDKEGNVHYTDCPPPPGCKAEVVQTQPTPSEQQVKQAQERLEKLLTEEEQQAALREQEKRLHEAQQVEAMRVAVARKRACILAQQNLHSLLMNRPVYYIDEHGEKVYLGDAAHKAEIEFQRQLVQENCNNQ